MLQYFIITSCAYQGFVCVYALTLIVCSEYIFLCWLMLKQVAASL